MTIKQQIRAAGGIAAYSRLHGIPYRTVQNWWREGKAGGRKPPAWLAEKLEAWAAQQKED